jgi:UDP-N-acetylmuramoyl-tripeptide--D-alanyl-D-alanine ligase
MTIEKLYQIFLQYPNVQTDTRKIQSNEIFFALKGDNFNGNTFAQQALAAGAAYVIIDEKKYYINDRTILVANVLATLQALARHHRMQFNIPFLAITGSNGKTTTKELIHAVMQQGLITQCTFGNLNNHIGVPLTLLSIKQHTQFVIVEMGANHQLEIASYCEWALPTHVLINNCGKAHLEGFGGIAGVQKGKGELYDFAKAHNAIVFRNADLDYLQEMAIARGITNEITYGAHQAHYMAKPIMSNGFVGAAVITKNLECTITSMLVGDYNFANIIGAIAVGSYFKINMDAIKKAIEQYVPSNSRSQLIQHGSNTIILDAYNANPTSMQAAINNFANATYPNKVLMLGGMKELGPDSIAEHQAIVHLINDTNWNKVVLVGGDFKHVQHTYIYFEKNTDAQLWLQQQQLANTAILIKGSRATAMEKVLA